MNARALSLLYHDVIDGNDLEASGFAGSSAGSYKLSKSEFIAHLQAIKAANCGPIVTSSQLHNSSSSSTPTILTFDDGGSSAWQNIAPLLEEFGWRGCFFITTDRIDEPGFLTTGQIRDLHARGHDIGSHSCSHPPRISDCSYEQLQEEWGRSLQVLEQILGTSVTIASVPGGFLSRKVVETAAAYGVQTLFTSEPRQRLTRTSKCIVAGRFMVKRGDPPSIVTDLLQGRRARRFRQFAFWNTKKLAKKWLGPLYSQIRHRFLDKN